jgi:hypothetical protein
MGNKEDGKKNRGLPHLLSLEWLQIFMSIKKRRLECWEKYHTCDTSRTLRARTKTNIFV